MANVSPDAYHVRITSLLAAGRLAINASKSSSLIQFTVPLVSCLDVPTRLEIHATFLIPSVLGEWINEFERHSLNHRNPSVLEPLMIKNVLAVRDSPCINPLTFCFL